eukprot:8219238-Alexandrium_andersonii.AAC.1
MAARVGLPSAAPRSGGSHSLLGTGGCRDKSPPTMLKVDKHCTAPFAEKACSSTSSLCTSQLARTKRIVASTHFGSPTPPMLLAQMP